MDGDDGATTTTATAATAATATPTATATRTTAATTTRKKVKRRSGIGRTTKGDCKRRRTGTTPIDFLRQNEVVREVPSFTLRVLVDDELVSNPDETNVDGSFVERELDRNQFIHEQWRASQIAIIFLRKKMAAGAKSVITLNNIVHGLKKELAQLKEEIRISKIIINNLEASSKKEMNKKQNLSKKCRSMFTTNVEYT